jgi:fermentation-respiration switch protein FrsA (DUF1100 family)
MVAIIVIGIMLALVALVLGAWRRQEHIVFQPPSPFGIPPDNCPSISYLAADGQKLMAFVVGEPSAAPGILIAFHGNAVESHWEIPWAREVTRCTGWCVVLPEYRGYAGLGGTPSYPNAKLDARAAYDAVRQLRTDPSQRVAFFGHSLGSAIAAELALETLPCALILQSPLSSARDMARVIVVPPMHRLWKLISRVHYDTELLVRSLDVPVSVAHGRRDMITPVSMGRRVHAAAKRKGALLVVERAAHNDVADRGAAEYWSWFSGAISGGTEER